MEKNSFRDFSLMVEQKRTFFVRFFIFLQTVQALVLLVVIANDPSMDRRAVIWGYSWAKLAMIVFSIFVFCSLLILTIGSLTRSDWFEKSVEKLNSWVSKAPNVFLFFLCATLYLACVLFYVLILFRSSFILEPPYILDLIINRAYYILLWVAIVACEISLFCVVKFWGILKSNTSLVYSSLLLFFIVFFSSFQWITLVSRAQWIFQLGWFWPYHPRFLQGSYIFLVLIWVLGIACIHFIVNNPNSMFWNTLASVFIFYLLMLSFGYAEGHGFESIRLKYYQTKHSDVARIACEAKFDLLTSVSDYENTFGSSFWLGTKPPGLFAFYKMIRDWVAFRNPQLTIGSDNCLNTLSKIFIIVIPVIFSLILIPIVALARLIEKNSFATIVPLLYMSAPNVLLMMLLSDQFLYPYLFILSILMLGLCILKKSFGLGILAGMALYLSIFVSFSLLPLLGMALFWFMADLIFEVRRNKVKEWKNYYSMLGIIVGVGIMWIMFALCLHYDPISRYQLAFQNHREIKHFEATLFNLVEYALLNNFEFAAWSGFPLLILFTTSTARSLFAFVRNRVTKMDIFSFAFFLTCLMINILGQTRGEVGRMWMFMLPVISIIAAKEIQRLFKETAQSVQLVFTLQFVTAVLMFIYMDFNFM